MKKLISVVCCCLMLTVGLGACRAKHSFNTREGKKKIQYYNSIQHRGYPTAHKNKN